ncbi:hypothetical protein ACFWG0_13965 [Streptomyces yangpuensis]|uniref:hypothetical protein n=1 Tax=Streptomyces yangpuensis TaxID=1648182 RepID=UPI00366894A0
MSFAEEWAQLKSAAADKRAMRLDQLDPGGGGGAGPQGLGGFQVMSNLMRSGDWDNRFLRLRQRARRDRGDDEAPGQLLERRRPAGAEDELHR